MSNYIDTYAYCLLPNHFHLLIKTKDSILSKNRIFTTKDSDEIGKIVSEQFRYFFISYAMSINKQESRSGSLFLKNFKRKLIDNEQYLRNLINYIHCNPLKHKIANDLVSYNYSSYKSLLSNTITKLKSYEVLNVFFNNTNEFLEYHKIPIRENEIEQYIIED